MKTAQEQLLSIWRKIFFAILVSCAWASLGLAQSTVVFNTNDFTEITDYGDDYYVSPYMTLSCLRGLGDLSDNLFAGCNLGGTSVSVVPTWDWWWQGYPGDPSNPYFPNVGEIFGAIYVNFGNLTAPLPTSISFDVTGTVGISGIYFFTTSHAVQSAKFPLTQSPQHISFVNSAGIYGFIPFTEENTSDFEPGATLATVTLSNLVINYSTAPTPDVSVQSISFSQNGKTNPDNDGDGVIDFVPGVPVTANVSISATNLPAGTSQLQVTFQPANGASMTQTADLSSGSAVVPFTFTPTGGGLENFTASVQIVSGETNTANNALTVQAQMATPYKLVAFMDGSSTPIPNAGGSMTVVPSTHVCKKLPASEEGDTDVEVRCVNSNDPTLAPVPGCQFTLSLSPGPDTGGHNHNIGDGTRPLILYSLPPLVLPPDSFPLDTSLSVDTSGDALTYVPPEVAGDVLLQVSGTDPNGNAISGPSFTFQVQDTTLGTLVDLNGAGAGKGPEGDNPGISVVVKSHPGKGSFGTEKMQAAVSRMVAEYYQLGLDNDFTDLHPLKSEAGTMVNGGLFDANWNGDVYSSLPSPWLPPHCGHRNGITIDLSFLQLDSEERKWLEKAARDSGLKFTSRGERPGDPGANHWHGEL